MIGMELISADLKRDEGERLKPYKDTVGKLTIGVGRNLDDVGISKEESAVLLVNDIARVEAALDVSLPWWRTLSENRQRVLINMCFNMGINALLGFTNTLKLIKDARYNDAAVEMLKSKWASQVGDRALRLSDLMRKG